MEERRQKDRHALNNVLPEDVWIILKPQICMENMSNASLYIRDLLYAQRVHFLFPKVLPLICRSLQCFGARNAVDSNSEKNILLKLRKLSKFFQKEFDNLVHPWKAGSSLVTRISSFIQEQTFLDYFQHNDAKSPFLGNSLELNCEAIQIPVPQPGRNLWRVDPYDQESPFQILLLHYGHHVRNCKLTLSSSTVSKRWFTNAVLEILRHMKNLQNLELYVIMDHYKYHTADQRFVQWSILNKLPSFKHLQQFRVTDHSNGEMTSYLVSKMLNLQKLWAKPLLNKKALRNSILYSGNTTLQNLEHLSFDMVDGVESWGLSGVKDEALHSFFRTLTENPTVLPKLCSLELWLMCTLSSTWRHWVGYDIRLPRLTSVTLRTCNWPCIDIALVFRDTLESLILQVYTRITFVEWSNFQEVKVVHNMEHIRFLSCYGDDNKIMSSNIWKELPKLKTLVVEVRDNNGEIHDKHVWKRR